MNRLAFSAAFLFLFAANPGIALAQQSADKQTAALPRGFVVAEHLQAKAKVQKIDYAKRTVVLKGEDGQSFTLKVSPEARNFNQVKVGDRVTADYYTSTAIFLSKSGAPPAASGGSTVALAAPGEKPAGIVTRTIEISAKVTSVDQQKRRIVVTGPRGNAVTLNVGDEVRNLSEVKPGDLVLLRYTQAIALQVEKT